MEGPFIDERVKFKTVEEAVQVVGEDMVLSYINWAHNRQARLELLRAKKKYDETKERMEGFPIPMCPKCGRRHCKE